jgi:hypothetical protein
MLISRDIGSLVAVGGLARGGCASGSEVGGAHSGIPIVCSARQGSVVGYAGGLVTHPAMANKINTEISKRFIIFIRSFST